MKSMHIDARELLDVQEKFKQFHNSIETQESKNLHFIVKLEKMEST